MKKNVVIIGAGINGLVASNYLQKNNFNVLLIEKNDHVGGACVKDSINYNNEKIFYPKGATVLGMMQKFILNVLQVLLILILPLIVVIIFKEVLHQTKRKIQYINHLKILVLHN